MLNNKSKQKYKIVIEIETTYDPRPFGTAQLIIDALSGNSKVKRKVKKIR